MAQASTRLDGQYVLGIAQSSTYYAVHTSEPDSKIYLLDRRTLAKTSTHSAHGSQGTTALRVADIAVQGTPSLISAGKDGSVVVWDERTTRPAVTLSHDSAGAGVLSLDALSSRNLIAAGAALQGDDASILYWDPRSPGAPTHIHASTHSDDITALHFRNSGDIPELLSASSDGLVCTSNPLEKDEDEAQLNVVNYGSSLAHAGWSTTGHVWASSDMETAALYTSELDLVHDFGDIRKPDVAPTLLDGSKFKTAYLVDAFAWGGDLCFVLGSNEGDAAVVSLAPSQPNSWKTRQLLRGAHSEIVRCVHWDAQAGALITGGEDSVVASWNASALADVPDVPMEEDSGRRKRGWDDGDDRENKRKRL
ncbi:WD40 repeat-like protein [Exidia glandulosa HHB12029]|uniref:WD40 repeat-like protein n=1 Tax=Exidia glandulosa HHB12029 TaxID=1314781 RepID=A0A165QWZ1_EXIGL|nr:WD40 repeat-like protein [Exidia glandulosa HHB12029]